MEDAKDAVAQISAIQMATVVKIMPTKVWIESSFTGDRIVVMQHEGCDPFDYATFGYDYRYTSNSMTMSAARNLALSLGATEPVEVRARGLPPSPTREEVAEQIRLLQELLSDMKEE